MISGKTLISLCHLVPDGASVAKMGPRKNNYGLTIDTLSNNDKSIFYKFNSNEMYPDHVLVYRDLEGMYHNDQIFKFSFLAFFVNFGSFFKGPADAHTSRLTDFVRHCKLSYRPGTRYNPQEQEFKGRRKGPSIKDVLFRIKHVLPSRAPSIEI